MFKSAMFADLQSQLNPDDISGYLYSAGLLTKIEHEDVNLQILASHQNVTKLLTEVEKAIHINPKHFWVFWTELINKDPLQVGQG